MMNAKCHCGAVSVSIDSPPEYINLCDCTLCLKTGGAWGYFSAGEVKIDGATKGYQRTDYSEPAVEIQFCPVCGVTTHWTLTQNVDGDRMGVNMRLFDPAEIAGIEARVLDGRNWFGKSDAQHRRPAGKVGSEIFI